MKGLVVMCWVCKTNKNCFSSFYVIREKSCKIYKRINFDINVKKEPKIL